MNDDIHRIGGGAVANLRLKPHELRLPVPGISALRCSTPQQAADDMRAAFQKSPDLIAAAETVGAASVEAIRAAGFDVIHVPSRKLPHHHRIIHPDGVAGFSDVNLTRLSDAFQDTTGH